MRPSRLGVGAWLFLPSLVACAGASPASGFGDGAGTDAGAAATSDGGGPADPGSPPGPGNGNPSGTFGGDAGAGRDAQSAGDATVVVTTTIYAHTDTALYAMDPKTKALTLIGNFTGLGGGTGDTSITDLAVNGAGDVYVNSASVIYKAALPAGGAGSVALAKVAAIGSTQKFLALGFTPSDALGAGTGEVLIGGDGNGELWSIDPSTGATRDLGGFGNDPSIAGNVLALSGDVVFYADAAGHATGLATIRSCTPGASGKSPSCTGPSDYLAGIDMTALQTAFATHTPAKSLNGGIYGGSSTASGAGTGHRDVFGLGVWEGNVYGFTRGSTSTTAPASPSLLLIETTGAAAGQGSVIPEQVSFTNGWSGAGVTTKVTVTIPDPPPPPPPPK